MNLPQFKSLMNDWFIIEKPVNPEDINEVKDNETYAHYYLHVGDVVNISEKKDESFAILRSIFRYKRDNQHFAFIIIDRFELTNQKKLECPVYRLQNMREICSISEVDMNNTTHFIHYCNDNECIIGSEHNFENDLYIKNVYFFKAV
ncbi:hypothetical protein F8M41_005599 [Gigaspora margarita]|uniref:BAH domain-containing protein n=1 Tax=Gigaspora margarita TaxID=4874 RepID=A0A8H4ERT8_GIGMA|nr:hypothetical protein F8M41_005599 [Gigaspora margarita]